MTQMSRLRRWYGLQRTAGLCRLHQLPVSMADVQHPKPNLHSIESKWLGTIMEAAERIRKIEEMLKDTPDDPELGYMLAMEYTSAGDDETAVGKFRDLISRVPDYPPAYHQAGRALQRLDRIDEARAMLQEGIPVAMKKGNEHAAGEMQELLAMLE